MQGRAATPPARGVAAVALMAIGAASAVAAAAEIHVNSYASPGGDGSPAAPFDTIADAMSIVADGDLVYVHGTFRESLYMAARNDVTIMTLPGHERAEIRGDRPVPPEAWSAFGDGTWIASIGEDLSVPSVVWNWDTNVIDAPPPRMPRHFGHLHRAGSAAEVGRGAGRWHYNAFTGTLRVSPPPGALPPNLGDTYAWCDGGSGIVLINCQSCTVSDFNVSLFCQFEDGVYPGYGVRLGGVDVPSSDNVVRNITIRDFGYHAAGLVDGVGSGNRFESIVACGQNNAEPGNVANPFVFYTINNGSLNNVWCDLVHHATPLLDFAEQPLREPSFYLTCNFHTDGVPRITDLEWRQVEVVPYDESAVVRLLGGSHTLLAADPADPATYPVRLIDSYSPTARQSLGGNANVAVVRCEFRSLPTEPLLPVSPFLLVPAGRSWCFESSVISLDRTGWPASELFRLDGNAGRLVLRGCSIHLEGSDGVPITIADATPNPRLDAVQSLFSRGAPGPLGMVGATVGPESLGLIDNWYWNIAPEAYFEGGATGGVAGIRTEADVMANVDPEGTFSVDPDLVGPPTNIEGDEAGALRASTMMMTEGWRTGINQLSYSGHVGAWQYGACPGDVDGSGGVDVGDLVAIILAWGPCGACAADVDADGTVNVADLVLAILGWGPC